MTEQTKRVYNQVVLIGNLGAAPELRYTNSGKAVCNLSICQNYNNREHWFRVTVWEGLAESAVKTLKKGSYVQISGNLRTQSWDDRGAKRTETYISAKKITILQKSEQAVEQESVA